MYRPDVGATMLKITKMGDMRPTVSTELKYLGLAESGRIKLRVLSNDTDTNKRFPLIGISRRPAYLFANRRTKTLLWS